MMSDRAVTAALTELLELDRRVAAKDPGAWRAREVARSAMREAWQLSEADGVCGVFEGGVFEVLGVERHHAACLERLSRVPFADVHSLELNALTSAELPACLVALEALKPQRLGLRGAHLKPEDLLQLARAPVVASLKQLVIEADQSVEGDGVIAEFSRTVPKRQLERLGLWNIWLTDIGLCALHGGGDWSALQHLTLAYNELLLGSSLLTLFEAACWPRLERLTLGCCKLDPEVWARVSMLPLTRQLRQLSLWGSNAGPEFWRQCARSPNWSELRRLNVEDSDFDGAAAQAMSRVRGWSLERLESYYTELPASAALALLRAGGLPNLRLRAKVSDVAFMQRLALRMFRKRFTFGSAHDCGTVQWVENAHFGMETW